MGLGECTTPIGYALRKTELVRKSGWPWMPGWRDVAQQGLLASQIPEPEDRHGLWVDMSSWFCGAFAPWQERLQDGVGPSKTRGQVVNLSFAKAE